MKIKLTDPGMNPIIKEYRNHFNMSYAFDLMTEHKDTYTRIAVTAKDEDYNDILIFAGNREIGSRIWKCEFSSDFTGLDD